MHVLITGGAGFIGSNFVRMVQNGTLTGISKVTVLDKFTYAGVKANLEPLFSHPNFSLVVGDICDSTVVLKTLEKVDVVVNFAAESHVDRSIEESKIFMKTNAIGVQTILDAIRTVNNQIRFLQVSTDEVYGSISEGSWDENSPVKPNSPYSASKAAGDLIALAYQKTFGLHVVITRCSNNYGPHHFPEKLIPLSITNVLTSKKIPVYGTGENIRDWLHVEDHCRGIFLAMTKGKMGEVYNIGGGQELTNLQIVRKILNSLGSDESALEFVEDRKGHDFRYSLNWQKAHRELGYSPQIDFETGLTNTINWYKKNENWWKPLLKTSQKVSNE